MSNLDMEKPLLNYIFDAIRNFTTIEQVNVVDKTPCMYFNL